ncbi:MAG: hypothetical protein A3G33_03180 [Omnitrophica bacterium RIFCSPLOWO2_12_FULL_44_17]|uniref:UDP-N-acetylglucosamine 2-epimerase domain-containing protein n=1 Tax=Candidatus Danuiimicrobium aquiferis TaxID=1801832 RepID=A0A1G1KU63_9BACT|nr:MAG: hypothetical protein A3B72_06725 [Omnitrophica bacterium RIFCSPHIGHO2_02_FULL_45_28]OGW96322.1 MAG: hypothetical protein A3G33_03180 [Omnitrophica bacterium RIFCSPLOWO2_12_FULL_44_17]OGX04246.1 MAG: hypothetical protein A3J12_10855 [Omnitrophica bacterium RIFCSPLOWO2_02_FULL_44_11]
MAQIVVLSNQAQYQAFVGHGFDNKNFTVLCDNELFYPFLDNAGIAYKKIDEFLLRDRWSNVNEWSWSKAAGFIRLMRTHRYFEDIDLPSIIFLWFSALLTHLLKNYLYALEIIKTYRPAEILAFSSQRDYYWPDYSGNAFLNYFLEELARNEKITLRILKINWSAESFRPRQSNLKKIFRAMVKKAIQSFYGILNRPAKKIDVMAYGTLRHLGSTLLELKKRGANVVFYDDEFRNEHFIFSLKNRIPYLIPECFPNITPPPNDNFVEWLKTEIANAVSDPCMKNHFLFETFNFGPFIKERFFGSMDTLFNKVGRERPQYEEILQSVQLKSLLLDEDFNTHAWIAAFMKSRGVPVYCVSHANWVLTSSIPQEYQCFGQSVTFVHSQHEKDTHADRGWNPEQIIVSGIPRYDRLIEMREKRAPLHGPVNILFCGAFFLPFSADTVGFIGMSIFAYRSHQEQAVRTLLRAAENLPLTITIKPQYVDDAPLWRQFVENERHHCKVEVVDANEDYFKLLMGSDAMAICAWSSTLIEAGIAGVPTFYLDLDNQNSDQVNRFHASGLCEIFNHSASLRQALEKLCSSERLKDGRRPLAAKQEYYLGSMDGHASSRVASYILEKIERQ